MADEIGRAVIEVDANTDRFEAAMAKATVVAEGSSQRIVSASAAAAAAASGIGDGAVVSLDGLDSKTKSVARNMLREFAQLKLPAGEFSLFNAILKGADPERIRPFVDQLEQARAAARALASDASRITFDKMLSEAVSVDAVTKNLKQLEASLDSLDAKEKSLAETRLFDARVREAAKLNKASEYVNFWTQALDKADAQEKKLSANNAFIAGLERQAAAIGKTRVDMLELEAAERGLTAQSAPLIAALRAQEKAIYGVSHASRDGRVNANQLRAAMQQLPAQFTDIFTSLAGGQNPLLVLIQQGGQINDSFRTAGLTLGGTFKQLLSLLTPLRLAVGGFAGVLAAVGFGYKQGAEESDEFVRSIVLTGNAAGLTAGQLQAMARAVAASGGTQGKAAEVLARFAASAKVGAAELQKVAQAAIGLERVGGPAVEETAKAFESLAKDPAKAAAALNEQTNFLTASIYKQIQALEEQGLVAEAAALAQSRFADVLASRKVELEANLGSIERGWIAIKDAIKGAADALLNIGRANTTEKQIEAGRAALDRLPSGKNDPLGIYEKQRKAIEAQLELLSRAGFREAERADAVRIRNEAERAGISLLQKQESLLDKEAKKTREIAEIRTLAAKSRLGNGPGISSKEEAALIAAVNEKYKEKQKKGEDLDKIYGSLIASSTEHVAAMAAEASGLDKLTQGEKRLLDMQSKIEAGTLTYNQALYAQAAAQFASEAAAERKAQAVGAALKLSEKLAQQEERASDALEKSSQSLLDQINKLSLGEEAFNAYTTAQMRSLAADLEWQAGNAGVDAGLTKRAALLRENAELRDRNAAAGFVATLRAQADAQDAANRELQFEATLIGQSAAARSVALAQKRIELKLEQDIARVRRTMPDDTPERRKIEGDFKNQADDAISGLASKQNIDLLNELLDPARVNAFGEAFVDAFEGANDSIRRAGASLSDFAGIFKGYAAEQERLSKGLKANREDTKSSPEERLRRENELIRQQGELQISTYASMAGAAKGFFNEGTKGYKAMQAAETVFRAYQLASDLVKGVSAAAVGIANQAQGDPYSALPRMAIMAAAMASLGFATGFLGKSGGGTQATAAQRQGGAATGRIVTPDQLDRSKAAFRGGSVFGDDEARSESIERSIDMLEKHARLELDYSRSQLSALEAIRDAMAGVANLIVRSVGGGLTSGKNLAIKTGTLAVNEGDPIAKSIGLGDLADKLVLPGLGGFVGKLQALWGKTTQEIIDSGLSIMGSVADLIEGQGVEQFADVKTTTSSFFGLSKKSKENTVFADVEDQLAEQFGLIFRSIGDSITASAEVLGREGGNALADAIASFQVDIPRLSLKGLKGAELEEAISAAIGAQADTIAQTLVPGLDAFQVIGQGYFETLVRVASGIEVANYQLELLGVTAIDYTSIIRTQGDVAAEIVRQSIVAAETAGGVLSNVGAIVNTLSGDSEDLAETYTQLVDVRGALVKIGESGESLTTAMIRGAGGLDNLADSLDTFFTEFFSEQEQFAANAGALAGEFAKLGVAMPGTRDEFRALVDVLGNDASEAGQKLFAKVVGLAGAFDEVADAAEEAAERLTDALVGGLERFGTPQERRDASFGAISTSLQRDAGVSVSIEQLIGASITDIEAFARSFLTLSGASDEAKAAVVNAAVALAELKDEAAGTLGSLETDLLRAQGREIEAVNRERAAELKQLRDLEITTGTATGTFTKLQEQIYAANDAAKLMSGLKNIIPDFLSGKDLAAFRAQQVQSTLAGAGIDVSIEQIINATSDQIEELFHAVGPAGKQALVDVYDEVKTLQLDLNKEQRKSLEDQLTGMKGLRDLAKDLKKFISELKFGDLSPLSAEAQLAEAQSLFETTLAKARGGDTKAQGDLQGIAQAFLQEAQGAFASGPGFTAIFDRVTSSLEALGLEGEALDPQIKLLEDIFGNDRKMLDTLLSIDSTLKGVPSILDLGGIGERDFVTGPAGSSGGLSGTKTSTTSTFDTRSSETAVIDFTPIVVGQQSVVANTAKQTELMERMLVKLDEVAAATNANAVIDQQAAKQNQESFADLSAKFDGIVRQARQDYNKRLQGA